MKKACFFAAVIMSAMLAPAYAEPRTMEEYIAAIQAQCATQWPNDYRMRIWCEDKETAALKKLIERKSIKIEGNT